MMGALQKVPLTGTMVTVMHTALANLAAMAPASPPSGGPFQEKEEGGQTSTDFGAPLEKDPYAGKEDEGMKKK
jgi:hypothetical protein